MCTKQYFLCDEIWISKKLLLVAHFFVTVLNYRTYNVTCNYLYTCPHTEASPLVVATGTSTTTTTANRVGRWANVAAIVNKIIKLKKASPVDKDAIRASVKELIDAKRTFAQHNDGIGVYGEKWEEPLLTKKQKLQAKEKAKMAMDAAAETQAKEKAKMENAAEKQAKEKAKMDAAADDASEGEGGKVKAWCVERGFCCSLILCCPCLCCFFTMNKTVRENPHFPYGLVLREMWYQMWYGTGE